MIAFSERYSLDAKYFKKFLSSCSDNFPYLNSSFRELRMKIIEYV